MFSFIYISISLKIGEKLSKKKTVNPPHNFDYQKNKQKPIFSLTLDDVTGNFFAEIPQKSHKYSV